ncbi:MAG: hypothetical protein LBD06_07080 [Candidatus Accumulibacter sp.]|nr:hypothetical protein [Accumulibacter sp.]
MQSAGDRGQGTGDRGQKTEDRRQKTDELAALRAGMDGKPGARVRGMEQRTEDR